MSELIDELLADGRARMGKAVEATQGEFSTVRTGRASPSLLDRVSVDYYGTQTPLKQLAGIHAEAQLLTVQPYDQNSIKAIEKSIRDSDLGLNPSNDGKLIRLAIPPLTEERRKEMVKVLHHIAEEGRGKIPNPPRDGTPPPGERRRGGEVGGEGERRAEAELQKITDERVAELDAY